MKHNTFISLLFLFVVAGFIACKNEEKEKTGNLKVYDISAKNIEKARSFYPMFEKGDWAGIEKIVSPDFTDHSPMIPPGSASNRDSLMKYLRATKEAFPDMKNEVLHAAADGDFVFVHYHFTGTNSGSFLGMPATNKKVDYFGVDIVKIRDGIAVEHWDYADNVTYLRQLGLIPENK